MKIPDDRQYTNEHEWAKIEASEVTVGITDYAQEQLGDVVYVELPAAGVVVTLGEAFGVVESYKAASDLNAPLSGEVLARNERLTGEPELVNASPYDEGWLIRIKLDTGAPPPALLSASDYTTLVAEEHA